MGFNITMTKIIFMRNKSLLFALLLCYPISSSWAGPDSLQVIPFTAEEVDGLKKLALYYQNWNVFLNVWAFLGPILGALATWLGSRRIIEKWAEEQITKKANEKLGVDWATVKLLVDEKKESARRQDIRIAIIGKMGKTKELIKELEKSNLRTEDFREHDVLPEKTEINSIDVLVIDNSDGTYPEDHVIRFFEQLKSRLPIVYLSDATGLSPRYFDQYKSEVKIIKLIDRLGETILKAGSKA